LFKLKCVVIFNQSLLNVGSFANAGKELNAIKCKLGGIRCIEILCTENKSVGPGGRAPSYRSLIEVRERSPDAAAGNFIPFFKKYAF